MNQNYKIFLWSLSAALGVFLFGFDTAVISGVEQTLQKLWNLNVFDHGMTINLLGSKGFDLHLLKNASNSSILSYDVASQTLSFDRTNSGNIDFNKRFSSIEKVKISPESNQLKLDILVDKSVVEIYANGGKALLTDLVFPLKDSSSIEMIWKK